MGLDLCHCCIDVVMYQYLKPYGADYFVDVVLKFTGLLARTLKLYE